MSYITEQSIDNLQTMENASRDMARIELLGVKEQDYYINNFCLDEEKALLNAIKEKDVRSMSFFSLELCRVVEMYLRAHGSFDDPNIISEKLMGYGKILSYAANNKLEYPEVNYRLFSEALKEASSRLCYTALLVKEKKDNYSR